MKRYSNRLSIYHGTVSLPKVTFYRLNIFTLEIILFCASSGGNSATNQSSLGRQSSYASESVQPHVKAPRKVSKAAVLRDAAWLIRWQRANRHSLDEKIAALKRQVAELQESIR
ncbi:unnamed protein product [Protopolystoma xenopodis]|uniref:Uncharacterized protein n=1 Tax=Protopolystoma xenopodis TaxID=117903 RepID=A0A448X7U7_9PLAT|nr:unnamed protein product [Protopolystoma xenopodis]